MTKGKPWTIEEENQLRNLIEKGLNAHEIAAILGKAPPAIYEKAKRLGLKVVISPRTRKITTIDLVLPNDLPSVEEALKILCAALTALQQGGLDQAEVFRLRTIIQGCKIYKELLADYVNYRGIEAKMAEMEAEYARILSEAKGLASKQADSQVEKH